jgi:hypothetical protein
MTDPNVDSVDPNNNPEAKATVPQLNPDLVAKMPPPEAGKPERTYNHPDPTPLWKIILEAGAVFVGLYVAGVYHGQLVVMQGQLGEIIKQFPEIKKSAAAAQSAAETADATLKDSQKSFVINERPYMVMDGAPEFVTLPDTTSEIQANATIRNIGKTPAIRVLWNINNDQV